MRYFFDIKKSLMCNYCYLVAICYFLLFLKVVKEKIKFEKTLIDEANIFSSLLISLIQFVSFI